MNKRALLFFLNFTLFSQKYSGESCYSFADFDEHTKDS